MKRALVALFLLALAACGPTVGAACSARADCDPGQDCFTQAPGGFCSRGCTSPGSTTECPAGSICTFFGGTTLVCSTYCTTDHDCVVKRGVNYECIQFASGGNSACRPTGVQ